MEDWNDSREKVRVDLVSACEMGFIIGIVVGVGLAMCAVALCVYGG